MRAAPPGCAWGPRSTCRHPGRSSASLVTVAGGCRWVAVRERAQHGGIPTMSGTTGHEQLQQWVEHWAEVLQPADIYWCDGSAEEYDRLCAELVASGTFTSLDQAKRPNSYWAHSDPGDVARVEDRTFICSESEHDAGPNNNWRQPDEMRAEMLSLYTGAMRGRTMYVVPFSMGPVGSP